MTSVGTIAIGHPISFELLTTRGKYGVYVRHDPEGTGKYEYVVCPMPTKRTSRDFVPTSAIKPFSDLESAETALKKWAAAPQPPRPPRKPKAALGACRQNGHPPKFRGDGTGQMFLNLELPKRKDPAPRSVNPDRVLRSFSDEEANKD